MTSLLSVFTHKRMVKLVLAVGLAAFFLPWWQVWLLGREGEYSWLGIPIPSYLVAPFRGDATFYGVIPSGQYYSCYRNAYDYCGLIVSENSVVSSSILIVASLTFLAIIYAYVSSKAKKISLC